MSMSTFNCFLRCLGNPLSKITLGILESALVCVNKVSQNHSTSLHREVKGVSFKTV